MYVDTINPVLLQLGSLQIRYYGLMYVIGILFCYYFVLWWIKHKNLNPKVIGDIVSYAVLGIILGGRLGYVLFYNPSYYFAHPIEILKFWEGGMSFHGGLIAVILLTFYYIRKHKLDFMRYADAIIIPVPVALALGRLGNFFNGELWGRPTNLPWGVIFPAAGNMVRHPSQLYEFAKNLIIFGILLLLSRKKARPGFLLFSFMLLYGVLRFLVEFVREPEIVFWGVTMGQWLSIPLIIIGAIGVYRTWKG